MKVSWDDDIPNMMEKIKNVPNHQPAYSSKPTKWQVAEPADKAILFSNSNG